MRRILTIWLDFMRTEKKKEGAWSHYLIIVVSLYLLVAWHVFEWRNPLANKMSFIRDFAEVVTWQVIEEYQAK